MKTKLLLLSAIVLASYGQSLAQTKFGTTPTTVNPGSLVEMEKTDKGLLLTRVSLTATETWGLNGGVPVNGMMVYNTNAAITATALSPALAAGIGVYYWDGMRWVGTGATNIQGDYWRLTGNAGTTPAATVGAAVGSANFWGTTDAQNLTVGTNGISRAIFDQSGNVMGGEGTSTQGSNSIAWGLNDTTNGLRNAAFGWENAITGNYNFVSGAGNTVNKDYSAAFGFANIDSGNASLVTGYANTVMNLGSNAIVGGTNNVLNGPHAAIFGDNNLMDNAGSSIIAGSANTVAGTGASIPAVAAFGNSNAVAARASLVAGSNNIISGTAKNSIVVGGDYDLPANGNYLSGQSSAVFGTSNKDSANNTLVAGDLNRISSNSTHTGVIGQNNIVRSSRVGFVAGADNYLKTDATGGVGQGNIIVGFGDTVLGSTGSPIVSTNGNQNAVFGLFSRVEGSQNLVAGERNKIYRAQSSTATGSRNVIDSSVASFIGGNESAIKGDHSFVFAYRDTMIRSPFSVSMGTLNKVYNAFASSTFGWSNIDSANFGFIGGQNNMLGNQANWSAVFGFNNKVPAAAKANFISGYQNSITNTGAVDADANLGQNAIFGYNNLLNADGTNNVNANPATHANFISGNSHQVTTTANSSVSGYQNNIKRSNASIVAGSFNKLILADGALVSGLNNSDSASYSVIGGQSNVLRNNTTHSNVSGFNNMVSAYANLVGGANNIVSTGGSGAGRANLVVGELLTLDSAVLNTGVSTFGNQNALFGYRNKLSGSQSIVSGNDNTLKSGQACFLQGTLSVIDTGYRCFVNGFKSYTKGNENVVLGSQDTVRGNNSFAFGLGAIVNVSNRFGAKFTNGYVFETGAGIGVTVGAGGTSWTSISDRRSKENIENISYGLATVMALHPTMYNYIGNKNTSLGFIAQEVQQVVPEVVELTGMGPNHDYLGVKYSELIPVLTKAIQEQQEQIDALKAENAQLKNTASATAQLAEQVREMQQMLGLNPKTSGAKIGKK